MILNAAAYQFTPIADPPVLAERLHAWAEEAGLRGSALVAPEGINLFFAGSDAGVRGLFARLHADPRFAGMRVKYSHSKAQPFARLKVKVKPEIISFRREGASPLARRAPTVSPATLSQWLAQGHDDAGKRVVMLDTRNAQEAVYGSFAGAEILPIVKFTDLPAEVEARKSGWADATVVSFCTGGIRCEKSVLRMQADGYDNCYQLEGGILGYFEKVGGRHYDGRCFVFDDRIALDPTLDPLIDDIGF